MQIFVKIDRTKWNRTKRRDTSYWFVNFYLICNTDEIFSSQLVHLAKLTRYRFVWIYFEKCKFSWKLIGQNGIGHAFKKWNLCNFVKHLIFHFPPLFSIRNICYRSHRWRFVRFWRCNERVEYRIFKKFTTSTSQWKIVLEAILEPRLAFHAYVIFFHDPFLELNKLNYLY